MTDNPYAAPEAELLSEEKLGHVQAVRRVARIFRVLGWFGFVGYGTTAIGAAILTTYAILCWGNARFFNFVSPTVTIDRLIMVAMTACYASLSYLGWLSLRTGKGLLNKQPWAYRNAIILSYLMLLVFPLTLLGAYCIVQLRRHWRAYCEELLETESTAASTG